MADASGLERLSAALVDRYRIDRELGAGGMATVYLAEDLKHKRQVAIKVLKPELAAVLGAERFVQEITTTAALQHPHILPLFDSGEAGGFLYYVMPFIDGETLRAKLDRENQLGVDESVRIATDVASALHYAHTHGVIHRDIKPENILLHDGRPMVADFGIALAVSAAAGGRMTETGLSLGTPHYMSPEQATAEKEITARSDVYSLGSVLYEMLTGEPPHMGTSAQQIIMKIITEDAAPVTRLRKAVPPNVAAAVAQALQKLPADRFASAREFAEALTNPGFVGAPGAAAGSVAGGAGTRRSRLLWPVATVVVAAAGLWGSLRERPMLDEPTAIFTIQPPVGGTVETDNGRAMDISRDGSVVVYIGRAIDSDTVPRMLFMRRIGDLDTRPIPGTEDAAYPFLSPDGAWAGFIRGDSVKRVPVAGGPVETIAVMEGRSNYGFWGEDGTVVVGQGGHVFTVPAVGGTITRVPIPDSINFQRPELLPGGKTILGHWRRDPIHKPVLADRATGAVTILMEDGTHPHYLPTGHLLFGRLSGGVFAVPFDLDRLAVTGPPVTMVANAMVLSGGAIQFAVADNGMAVYLTGTDDRTRELVLVDGTGSERVIGPRGDIFAPRVSPDGRHVAVSHRTPDGVSVQVVDVATGVSSRRTFSAEARNPIWSRDGRSLTFWERQPRSTSAGLYQVPADGSGAPRLLIADSTLVPGDWAPDGRSLLVAGTSASGQAMDFQLLTFAGDSAVQTTYLREAWNLGAPAIAPGGSWVAYPSWEHGSPEVLVESFPTPGARYQISSGGGYAPRWSADGRTLYYLRFSDGTLVAATVRLGAAVEVLEQRDAPGIPPISRGGAYDAHPDGRHFVIVRELVVSRPDMIVATNWFTTLRGRLGGAR